MSLKLKIVNNNFTFFLTIKSNTSVFNVKEKIFNMENLLGSVNNLDIMKCSLFHVRKCQLLENDKHLDYYKLEDFDEIIFSISNRTSNSQNHEIMDNKITDKDIEEATRNLEGKNLKNINEKSKVNMDRILRSVLVTLIEISQNILCLNKTASDLFQYVQKEISSHIDQNLVTPDQNMIHTLLEMGISREKAYEALKNSNNNLNNALNLIFSQQTSDISDYSGSISNDEINNISIRWITDENGDLFVKPMATKVILKLYRDYNRKFFRPHVTIRERLIDMGFEETTVNEALRINNNNEIAAVDSLLNPSSLVVDSDDENEIEGLPHDHELMVTILGDSDIQLGLLNIYSLLAFLNIVDNPKNLNHWLANPETKVILQQISNITTDFISSFD